MDAIKFNHGGHKHFYHSMLKKTRRWDDVYYRALFYLLGVCGETRKHIDDIFDFEDRSIKPEALYAPWQTGSTVRLTLIAFNLWNGWTEDGKENLSSPYQLFDCWLAPYFWESIRLRYPEYCNRK